MVSDKRRWRTINDCQPSIGRHFSIAYISVHAVRIHLRLSVFDQSEKKTLYKHTEMSKAHSLRLNLSRRLTIFHRWSNSSPSFANFGREYISDTTKRRNRIRNYHAKCEDSSIDQVAWETRSDSTEEYKRSLPLNSHDEWVGLSTAKYLSISCQCSYICIILISRKDEMYLEMFLEYLSLSLNLLTLDFVPAFARIPVNTTNW